MIENGRPRYWIEWYDRWYLLLPLLLIAVVIAVGRLPNPAASHQPSSPGLVGLSAQPRGANPMPIVRPPLPAPMLTSPRNGTGFFFNRIADAEGRSQPGVIIHLEYAALDLVWHELARMPTDADGGFHFQLKNFPPGNYRLRARAVALDGRGASSPEAMITVLADATREVPRRRRNR